MPNSDTNTLIKKLESLSVRFPRAYKTGAVGLALIGYLFILIAVVTCASIITVVAILLASSRLFLLYSFKLIAPLLVMVYGVIHSFRVKIDPPTGVSLNRGSYPKLFSLIDQIRTNLKTPKIHEVLISNDYMASVVQYPRLGLLGWYKNYLVLGFPLMLSLSPEQFTAVLAHELAHISKSHGRISTWIYRVNTTWQQLSFYFEQHQHWSYFLFKRFFTWFSPRFHNYTFVLLREHEYDADSAGAEIAGSGTMAAALINTYLQEQYLEEDFWPVYYKLANDHPIPEKPFSSMASFLQVPSSIVKRDQWLEQFLESDSNYLSVHPSLKARLMALGEEPCLPQTNPENAAHLFLAASYEDLMELCNTKWINEAIASWQKHYENTQRELKTMNEYKAQFENTGSLDEDDLLDYAYLNEKYFDEEKAWPLYQMALRRYPESSGAMYHNGRLLLQKAGQEDKAIDLINSAMKANPDWLLDGSFLLHDHYSSLGQTEEADKCYRQAADRLQILRLASEEREVYYDRKYTSHGLSNGSVDSIVEILIQYPQIQRAYLVRRKVQYLPDKPMYVLAVLLDFSWNSLFLKRKRQQLMARLASGLVFQEEIHIIHLCRKNRPLNFFKSMKGACIYLRKRSKKYLAPPSVPS